MTDATADDGPGDAAGDPASETGSYSVLRRSFEGAVRSSDSLLLRLYALAASLVGLCLVLTVLLALPNWIAQTEGHTPLNMAGRALLPVIVLALLVPLVAPVVYAARNHRAGRGRRRGDAALGLAGFLFVLSIYLSLVVSAPAEYRTEPSGALAPAVRALYEADPIYGLVPPVLGAVLVAATQRLVR